MALVLLLVFPLKPNMGTSSKRRHTRTDTHTQVCICIYIYIYVPVTCRPQPPMVRVHPGERRVEPWTPPPIPQNGRRLVRSHCARPSSLMTMGGGAMAQGRLERMAVGQNYVPKIKWVACQMEPSTKTCGPLVFQYFDPYPDIYIYIYIYIYMAVAQNTGTKKEPW